MHRLPPAIAVAVFDRPDAARLLNATRYLDGRLVFQSTRTEVGDAPLLIDRLGLKSNTLLFTRGDTPAGGRDTIWHAPDDAKRRVDLRIDEPFRMLARMPDGPLLLAGHRDHVVPALVMTAALTRLAAALRLPGLAETGVESLLRWLPPRPLPPLPFRVAPLTTIALAFARAAALHKGC
jgi:hypothetical protein